MSGSRPIACTSGPGHQRARRRAPRARTRAGGQGLSASSTRRACRRSAGRARRWARPAHRGGPSGLGCQRPPVSVGHRCLCDPDRASGDGRLRERSITTSSRPLLGTEGPVAGLKPSRLATQGSSAATRPRMPLPLLHRGFDRMAPSRAQLAGDATAGWLRAERRMPPHPAGLAILRGMRPSAPHRPASALAFPSGPTVDHCAARLSTMRS